jgi:hypothetical protein
VIQTIGIAVVFVVLAALAFVASVRLGMLLGLRLDRALEARAAAGAEEELAPSDSVPSAALQQPIADDKHGREEYRGE